MHSRSSSNHIICSRHDIAEKNAHLALSKNHSLTEYYIVIYASSAQLSSVIYRNLFADGIIRYKKCYTVSPVFCIFNIY